jgi:hypothetical protein
MMEPYHAHLERKRAQREMKKIFFRALRLYWKSERLFRVSTLCSLFCCAHLFDKSCSLRLV